MTDEAAEKTSQETGSELKRIPGLSLGDRPTPAVAPGSDTGLKEAKLLSNNLTSDEIAAAAAINEHGRTERFRDHFEHIAICGLWILATVFLVFAGVWFWHTIAPERWHWLTPDVVARLQNLLTGGIFATMAGGYLKKRM